MLAISDNFAGGIRFRSEILFAEACEAVFGDLEDIRRRAESDLHDKMEREPTEEDDGGKGARERHRRGPNSMILYNDGQ